MSDVGFISKLKVMRSNAGYYVGTSFVHTDQGNWEEPNSRETGYFRTRNEAELVLHEMEEMEDY